MSENISMNCKHPQETVQYFSGISMGWCSLCGALHHPGPGNMWEVPTGYAKMAADLTETLKALNNLLGRVKFDENTPPGEHWHVMTILAGLVLENNALKELISDAAPLCWATSGNIEEPYEWEKRAEKLL